MREPRGHASTTGRWCDSFPHRRRASSRRWTIEESLRPPTGRWGLDQYEVRRYPNWYRNNTLSMLALAYLAVVRILAPPETAPQWSYWRCRQQACAQRYQYHRL